MYVTRSSHGFIDERNQTRGSQFSSDWSTGSADVPPAAVLTLLFIGRSYLHQRRRGVAKSPPSRRVGMPLQ